MNALITRSPRRTRRRRTGRILPIPQPLSEMRTFQLLTFSLGDSLSFGLSIQSVNIPPVVLAFKLCDTLHMSPAYCAHNTLAPSG